MNGNGRMGQAPPAEDRAQVVRRHDEAMASLARADQRLDDLETALQMRRIDYERAREWHDRMMGQLRGQVRGRAVDASPERLKEIERVSSRYEAAREALRAAQDAWDQGSADHAAFTARLRALHYARLLSALAGAFPADAAAAGLAKAWTDYALGRPGAKRPSIIETSGALERARSGQTTVAPVPRGWLVELPRRAAPARLPPPILPTEVTPVAMPPPPPTTAERIRAARPPYAPLIVQPVTSIAPLPAARVGPTSAVWGTEAPPPWIFRLPPAGVRVALPLT